MAEVFTSYPVRRWGMIFQLLAALGLILGVLFGLSRAARAQSGIPFLFWIALTLVFFGPIPWLVYRLYALWTASYTLERDGIRLRWGFRFETVPVDTVMWVRMAQDFSTRLPFPWLIWPGAVVGARRLPQGQVVEFLASQSRLLVLLATPDRIYAISPADPEEFISAFRQFSEMGSLSPLTARSEKPTSIFSELWADPVARYLLLGAILLAAVLLGWVSLVIPGREKISLRYSPAGAPADYIPAVQLLLLPVINGFFSLADIFLGLFFYRRPEIRPLAYLLWSSGSLVSLLFMGAVMFITRIR